ncbi:MAG: hypothetical protein WCP57_05205 [Bacteroidota bacterium]
MHNGPSSIVNTYICSSLLKQHDTRAIINKCEVHVNSIDLGSFINGMYILEIQHTDGNVDRTKIQILH